MRAGQCDTEIAIYRIGGSSQDSVYGRPLQARTPFEYAAGSPSVAQRYMAEVQDLLPSRQEGVQQGLVVGKRQTRIRLRYIAGLDSSMEVDIYGDNDAVETHRIIGGPSVIGRREWIELLTEIASS